MKSDQVNLVDMLRAAENVRLFTEGMSEAEFVLDDQTIAAASFELMALGEASKNVTERTRRTFSGIPWSDLRLVRNMVAHEHNVLNPHTLWRTLVNDLPQIEDNLRNGLRQYE